MQILDKHKINEYYEAVKNRDTNYIGSFFLGVKTTGVFCIPGCKARTPKLANIVFYTGVNEIMAAGFRPCKLCKPTHNAYSPPEEAEQAIKLIHASPFEKITDTRLLKEGIRPEKVRRWFKKNYGMTFHAYQRMYRINLAYQDLKEGKKVTDSAMSSSYESLSGFSYTFKTLMGAEPQKGKFASVIHIKRITTPIGPVFIGATEKGLCLLEFTDRKMMETELLNIQKQMKAVILFGKNKHVEQTEKELNEYFKGKKTSFNIPVDTRTSEFQEQYIKHLQNIKYGETESYESLANKMSCSTQAIKAANGKNNIAIIIPCHRVIGESGNLTGYGGGIRRKKWLLDHEKNNI